MSTEQSLVESNTEASADGAVVKRESVNAPVVIQDNGVSPLVQMFATGQYSTEQIREFMELQRQYDADNAMKAYHQAMAKARAEMGVALRLSKNDYLNSTYANLDSLIEAARPALSANGFNFSFKPDQSVKGEVTEHCLVTHAMGHTETYSVTMPIEGIVSAAGKQAVNGAQKVAIAMTYAKRYAFSAATGIATEDRDGQTGAPAKKEAPSRPTYTDKRLKEMWPKWVDRIKSGSNDSSTIINQVSNGFSLTNDQMKELMKLSQYDKKVAVKTTLTDKEFSAAFKGWMTSVESAEKKPADLITIIEGDHELTDAQRVSVMNLHDSVPAEAS